MFKENTIPELGDYCEVSPPVSSGAGGKSGGGLEASLGDADRAGGRGS